MLTREKEKDVVIRILEDVLQNNFKADQSLSYHFKKNRVTHELSRTFIAESVYDVLRNFRFYKELASAGKTPGLGRIIEIPGKIKKNSIPEEVIKRIENIPAIRYSIPDWLYELGEADFGEKWLPLLRNFCKPPSAYIRVNRLKTDLPALEENLKEDGIESERCPNFNDALKVDPVRIFRSKVFREGWFELQDLSSQRVAEACEVKPGMRVVDACAGNGGKSLHLASLMGNKGKIISMDPNAKKLADLRRRASRAGVDIIETRETDSKAIKRIEESADVLLLDVPCTGTGVLRRNPDIKWKLKEHEAAELVLIQKKILSDTCKIVKRGGRLIYSTCSFLKQENENQIKEFISSHPEFSILSDEEIFPSKYDGDFFYIAVLERN